MFVDHGRYSLLLEHYVELCVLMPRLPTMWFDAAGQETLLCIRPFLSPSVVISSVLYRSAQFEEWADCRLASDPCCIGDCRAHLDHNTSLYNSEHRLCISTWCPMDHHSHHTTLTSTHRHLPSYKGCRAIPFLQFFWTLFIKPLTPYGYVPLNLINPNLKSLFASIV